MKTYQIFTAPCSEFGRRDDQDYSDEFVRENWSLLLSSKDPVMLLHDLTELLNDTDQCCDTGYSPDNDWILMLEKNENA